MARSASPIDIATPARFNSTSPRNQQSTLTFALQEAGATNPMTSAVDIGGRNGNEGRLSVGGRQDSISNGLAGSYYGNGARPIMMKDRNRRESNTGSLLNGMSWGGASVGSWVRDDVIMAGTSPYAFHQSPSFHSTSYLPKMESQFMKDFNCCGKQLDSLHDLLQHYEECHAQPPAQATSRPSQSEQGGFGGRTDRQPSHGLQNTSQQQSGPNLQRGFTPAQNSAAFGSQQGNNFNRTQLSTVQDVDTLEDMEMDDAPSAPQQNQNSAQNQFGQNNQRLPQLNINVANAMPTHQTLRGSNPNTPSANQNFNLQNNPTVSSVNTPTLGTHSLQQSQNKSSPESSVPGTPAEYNEDILGNPLVGTMGFGNQMMSGNNADWGRGFGVGNDLFGTIDQPAKRLLSSKGQGGLSQRDRLVALGQFQGQFGNDSELAKQLREQQLLAGLDGTAMGLPQQEHKPYKCPVIGCEKAYKNQNGLKYHKVNGHKTQTLKDNQDGTFSIVDPETSIPYPGTMGMEKEKPYKCDHCHKRYKNLNGLKYHRQHSDPCNPDKKLNALDPNTLAALNVNVAGMGLVGMNDGLNFT